MKAETWTPVYHLETTLLGWYTYDAYRGEYHYQSAVTGMSWAGDDYFGIEEHLLDTYLSWKETNAVTS